jgi:cell division inhibitor SepF
MPSLVQRIKDMWTPPDDEYDYEDEKQEEETIQRRDHYESSCSESARTATGNKVVNIHATAQLQVVLFKPEKFGEETRVIADELLKTHTVVLNLEKTEGEPSRRILDFLSGVAYANSGKIKRIATSTYIITPYNVDLKGDDLLDELENNGVYF